MENRRDVRASRSEPWKQINKSKRTKIPKLWLFTLLLPPFHTTPGLSQDIVCNTCTATPLRNRSAYISILCCEEKKGERRPCYMKCKNTVEKEGGKNSNILLWRGKIFVWTVINICDFCLDLESSETATLSLEKSTVRVQMLKSI